MKLLFVTCLRDFKSDVMRLFHQAGIKIFSITETLGIKDEHDINLLEDWFGNKEGEYDSLIVFSFTSDQAAQHAMSLVNGYNEAGEGRFPIRAFILPVEVSNYQP
jgi:hypothetical protein